MRRGRARAGEKENASVLANKFYTLEAIQRNEERTREVINNKIIKATRNIVDLSHDERIMDNNSLKMNFTREHLTLSRRDAILILSIINYFS